MAAPASKGFVGIYAWPEGVTEAAMARAIATTTGIADYDATMLVRRGFPQVLPAAAAGAAELAAQRLRGAGVDVLYATPADLAFHAGVDLARSLHAGHDETGPTYLAQLWNGATRVVRTADIRVIVRGRLKIKGRTEREVVGPTRTPGVTYSGGLAGAAIAGAMSDEAFVVRKTPVRISEIVDLHLVEDAPVRLHGDKFSFDVLGRSKGITDNENMDLLAVRLAEESAGAMVDTGYGELKVPGDVLSVFLIGSSVRQDARVATPPEFAFYSAWTAVRWRELLGF